MAFIETTIRTAGEYAYECATISIEIPDEAMELIREFWKSLTTRFVVILVMTFAK